MRVIGLAAPTRAPAPHPRIATTISQFVGVMVVLDCAAAIWRAAQRGTRARRRPMPPLSPRGTPLVSILVPAWADADCIGACIESVKHSEYQHWECVVAAGGQDGTYDAARAAAGTDPRLTVIAQRPRGKNAALNDALRHTTGEIVVLMDADCVLDRHCLERLIAPITRDADAALTNYQAVRLTPISRARMMAKIAAYDVDGAVTLHGGVIAVRRSLIERLAGFPEDVLVGVDWDLDARIQTLGGRRVYVGAAVQRTPLPSTVGEYWRNELRWRQAHWGWLLHRQPGTPRAAVEWLLAASPYAFACGAPVGAGLSLFLWKAGLSHYAGLTAEVLLWGVGRLAVRRTTQAAASAALTGDVRWLLLAWVPAALLFLDLVSAGLAVLRGPRRTPHFKGARHAAEQES